MKNEINGGDGVKKKNKGWFCGLVWGVWFAWDAATCIPTHVLPLCPSLPPAVFVYISHHAMYSFDLLLMKALDWVETSGNL